MVEMKLSRIILHEKRDEQIIVLKEKNGKKRELPIVIGLAEAAAIKMKINKILPPRPLTHDLLKNLIEGLGFKLEKVIIDGLQEGTFYAKLVLVNSGSVSKKIDCRPSDAIALSVRTGTPVYVNDEVLEKIHLLGG
ncbi:MAG: bifunctional nuclease family protein [Candidatus Omnitrophota bacterium]